MTHRVAFVVFDGCTMLDLTAPVEVLHLAGRFGGAYDTVLVSPGGGTVTSSSTIAIADTVPAHDVGPVDTVIVVGGDRLAESPLDADLLATVAALDARAARVASVCTGAFVLAELGLLDGRRATTHWRHAAMLAQRYPRIHVDPDVIHVHDGRCVTSAGITAGIDMALSLVERDHGVEVSRRIARELVVFLQRSGGQLQYASTAARRPAAGSPLRTATDAVLADLTRTHTVASMAAAASVSERHLARWFRAELGTTPAQWVERARLDRAKELVLDERLSITDVAHRSGFGSDETLRRAFARHLATTPTAYRQRFATTHAPRRP